MRRIAMLLLLSILTACGDGKDESTSEAKSVVYNTAAAKWPNPRAIPVCVMNKNSVGRTLFNDIKNYVTHEYTAKTGVNFTGWESCTSPQLSAKVIRIYFNLTYNWASSGAIMAGGGLSMVGTSSSSCGSGCAGGTMRLDIGRSGEFPPTGSSYSTFIVNHTRASAMHEFGHALGLMHEQQRADAVGCVYSEGNVISGPPYVYIGAYDTTSIMNYCHAGTVTTLSPGDVAGIDFLYPVLLTGH
ncbi:MAG: hypothetical protein H7249_06230 [Chitinophagaceae bacterium]|nr:hypothetical protein [Oligoflexus sp.]